MTIWDLVGIISWIAWAIQVTAFWCWGLGTWFARGTRQRVVLWGVVQELRPIVRENCVAYIVTDMIVRIHQDRYSHWHLLGYAAAFVLALLAYHDVDDDDRWGKRFRRLRAALPPNPRAHPFRA